MDLPKQLHGHYLILYVGPDGTTHVLNAATAARYHPAMFNELFEAMETARANRRREQCREQLTAILEAGCPGANRLQDAD